jgi:hypothetical protein
MDRTELAGCKETSRLNAGVSPSHRFFKKSNEAGAIPASLSEEGY